MDPEAPPTLSLAATSARAFLERIWPRWHAERGVETPSPPSASTCGRSSAFLHRVLLDDCGLAAEIGSGAGGDETGFNGGGAWESHSWVEAGGWIVDVTADQFGAPPVVVTCADDARYRKGRDLALPDFKAARLEAVARAWPDWLASAERRGLVSD